MATINMQTMRYINLLDKVSRVKTMRCFFYNGVIFFAVPRHFIRKAIGDGGRNIKVIQETLGKKIKIIREAENQNDIRRFIQDIVDPMDFESIQINDHEIVLTAGNRNRAAALIGRNKVRFEELNQIIKDNFDKELRIV